jgi:hypothetical protein
MLHLVATNTELTGWHIGFWKGTRIRLRLLSHLSGRKLLPFETSSILKSIETSNSLKSINSHRGDKLDSIMIFKCILMVCFLVASVTANPGLLHDESHHTHVVLENIHVVPHCAYSCIFHDTYAAKFAPDCVGLKGIEYGACLCRSNAYQYIFDQCVAIKCSKDDSTRKQVFSLLKTPLTFRRGK